MNRNSAIALGLSSLVLGAVAATVPREGALPAPAPPNGPRPTPPPRGRHAFASRDGVQVRSAPSPTAPIEGTFGFGSGFVVGPEELPGWFPIVREWVNEDGSRTTRNLAFVSAADITFTDPRRVTLAQLPTPVSRAASEYLAPGAHFVAQIPFGAIATTLGTAPDPTMFGTPQSFITVRTQPRNGIATSGSVIARHAMTGQEVAIPDQYVIPTDSTAIGQVVTKPGKSDGGECDLFVSINWPSNVDDFKRRLDTVVSATDRSVRECAALSRAQQDEWAVFRATWREFATKPTPTFGSGREWDSVCSYARILDGWREAIANTNCALVGPTNIHGYEVSPGVENSLASVASIVKWGTLAIGGVVLFGTFYPEIREGMAALRARRTARKRSSGG